MIYTVWTADHWLSYPSFGFQGVFSTIQKAIYHAKENQLLHHNPHVVIYKAQINHYQLTEEKVFSTEFEQDRSQIEVACV